MEKSAKTREQRADEVAALHRRITELEALSETQQEEIERLRYGDEKMLPATTKTTQYGDDPFTTADHLYRAVFESTGTAMVIVDENMVIRRVNSEVETISGYSRREVEGRDMSEFISSDDLKRMSEYHELRMADPTLPPRSYEFAYFDRNGLEKCAYVTVAYIPETRMSIASFVDITEKKNMEDKLRASEDRYRTFVDSASDMIFLKDDEYRYLIVNKALSCFFGKEEAEIIGKTDFELMTKDAAQNCRQSDMRSIDEKTVVVCEEHGGGKIFETLKFPVTLNSGMAGIGGFIRDITEKKQIETALQESEEKYRLLIDNVGQAIFVAQDGFLKFANSRMVEISGYSE